MGRTIIVGAGINGMLLGALLAHDGEEVTLFEKNPFPGGRAYILERDGFTVDYGMHLTRFGPKSALAKIMARIGRPVSFRRLGTSWLIDYDGRRVIFPTSPGGIFKSDLFTPMEKLKILSLLLKIKKGRLDEGLMDVSLRDWIHLNNISGGIRRYLELLSASVMVCPFIEKTSAGEMFRNMRRVLATGHSAEYLVGGWKPVMNALIETISRRGEIRLGQKVDSVILAKGVASGVLSRRKRHLADRVVINLPVQEIFSILPASKFDPSYVKLCKNMEPTSGIFIDITLEHPISDYDGLLYTYRPMAYGIITSNLSQGIAPPGRQLFTMFYPTAAEDLRDQALRSRRREELWEGIRRFFPDIDRHILWKRESFLKMVDGCQVNTSQTEDKRPTANVPGYSNLFLVGDSIAAPGAGGDVGNESVLAAYRAITGISIE